MMLSVKAGPHTFTAEEHHDTENYPGIQLQIDGVLVCALEFDTTAGLTKVHVWQQVYVDDEDPITIELDFD